MTVGDLEQTLVGKVVAGAGGTDRDVLGGYVSDLLSDVVANAEEGDIWVTLQRHVNIVAVAQLKGLAGIVLVNGRLPEPAAKARADKERLPIVSTPMPAFDVVGTLHGLGVRSSKPC